MTTTQFNYTGAVQTYTVPAGVTYVTLQCWASSGQAQGSASGGSGGFAQALLIVSPGTVLNLYVGGTSWNGGGAGGSGTSPGGAGAGATDIRMGGTALANRIMVAGGGGGAGGGNPPTLGANKGGGGGGATGVRGGWNGGGWPGYQNWGLGTGAPGYALGRGQGGGNSDAAGGGGGGGGYYGALGCTDITGHAPAGGGGGGSGFLGSALTNGTMQTALWSGAGKIVIQAISNPPLAPTLTGPPNNGYIIATEANAFTWTYSNVDWGGYQSRADFQYKQHPADAWTTLTSIATTASSYTLPANTWAVGNLVEWQVKAYGAFGAASPWSASRFTNTIASVPAPTLTAPISGTNEFATPIEADWTLPGAFTQDAYQIQRADLADGSGVVYYDSGTAVGTALSAMVPLDVAAGRTDYVRVRFRYSAHWSAWASVDVLNEFGPPAVASVYVVQTTPGKPEVTVTVTNPPAGGGFADTLFTDVFRTSPDGSTVRIATNLPNNSTFTDLLPTAGVNEYIAVAYAASGGSATSPVGYFPTPPSPYSDQYTNSY